jgi:hypothetical protein
VDSGPRCVLQPVLHPHQHSIQVPVGRIGSASRPPISFSQLGGCPASTSDGPDDTPRYVQRESSASAGRRSHRTDSPRNNPPPSRSRAGSRILQLLCPLARITMGIRRSFQPGLSLPQQIAAANTRREFLPAFLLQPLPAMRACTNSGVSDSPGLESQDCSWLVINHGLTAGQQPFSGLFASAGQGSPGPPRPQIRPSALFPPPWRISFGIPGQAGELRPRSIPDGYVRRRPSPTDQYKNCSVRSRQSRKGAGWPPIYSRTTIAAPVAPFWRAASHQKLEGV